MDYTLQPSLEQFTAVRIAIQLWQAQDIRQKLAHFVPVYSTIGSGRVEFYKRKLHEEEISKLVLSKVNGLPLPEMIKTSIRDIIGFIGYEIVTSYNEIFCKVRDPNFDNYIDRLRWTPWGTVDRRETVKPYLDDKNNFHGSHRYVWACKFGCIDSDVDLWNERNIEFDNYVSCVEKVYTATVSEGYVRSWDDRKRVMIELYRLPGLSYDDFSDYCSLTHLLSLYEDNIVRKFDLNAPAESKSEILDLIANCNLPKNAECCREILFVCVSQMNTKQREVFVERNSLSFLTLILSDWSRRKLFLQTFRIAINFLNRVELGVILIAVAGTKNRVFADVGECRKLFEKVWIDSPDEAKVVSRANGHMYRRVVHEFVSSQDVEMVKFIMNDANERFVMANINVAIALCPMYIERENFDQLEMFLIDLLETDDNVRAFTSRLVSASDHAICAQLMHGGKWKLLDRFVKWCLPSYKVERFKLSLVLYSGLKICTKWVDRNDVGSIDKFKNWCFSYQNPRNYDLTCFSESFLCLLGGYSSNLLLSSYFRRLNSVKKKI